MMGRVLAAEHDGVLDEEETLTNLVSMLIAGHETTVTLDRQRPAAAVAEPGRDGAPACRPHAHAHGGRGIPARRARRKHDPAHCPRGHRGRRLAHSGRIARHRPDRRGEPRSAALQASPTRSTSDARPTPMQLLAAASTSVSARRWRGWKRRSLSTRCSTVSRHSSLPAAPNGGSTASTRADWGTCRFASGPQHNDVSRN